MEFAYDVFLSYRHKPLDQAVTQKAFNILESYKLPASLRKRGFAPVRRAFRDAEELAVSRILSKTIDTALRSTNCLIVVCSTDTPNSEWVDREVETFIELGRSRKVFPLLIEGSPETSFPKALAKIPDIEDRILDARAAGNDPAKIIKNARPLLLRVIAEAGNIPAGELIRAEKMRSARNTLAVRTGAVAFFALTTLVSMRFWMAAEQFRAEAEHEQSVSMAILSTLTYGLPDNLVELPHTYGAVASILEENAKQIEEIIMMAKNRDSLLPEVAANYERFATAMLKIAGYERALESQKKAVGITKSASSVNNLGVIYEAMGDFGNAASAYKDAIELHEKTNRGNDKDREAKSELAVYIGNLAVCKLKSGDIYGAEEDFAAANTILYPLSAEGQRTAISALAANLNNMGVLHYQRGQYEKAEAELLESVRLAQEAFEKNPNRTLLFDLTRSQISLATCYSLQAKFDEAINIYELAVSAQELLAGDLENADAQKAKAIVYNNYGLCLNMAGDYPAALSYFQKSADVAEAVLKKTGSALSQASLARYCYNAAETAFKMGDYALSRQYYNKCLALYEPVSAGLGVYHQAEYLARRAYYMIIFERNFGAALADAAAAADLLPDSSFVLYILGYALLYNDMTDACDIVFRDLASRSPGEVVNVRLDFLALSQAGLDHPYMGTILKKMEKLGQKLG